jgi:hypothetical protein
MTRFCLEEGLSPEIVHKHLCQAAFHTLARDGYRLRPSQKQHLCQALLSALRNDICVSPAVVSERLLSDACVRLEGCKTYDWDLISNLYAWGLIGNYETTEKAE